MANKMRRNVSHTNPLASEKVDLPGDSGVFGANPAPGFNQYPETKGKMPLKKFQETDIGRSPMQNTVAQNRPTKTIPEIMGLKTPGTTKIITGKNRYESNVKSSNTNKNKI